MPRRYEYDYGRQRHGGRPGPRYDAEYGMGGPFPAGGWYGPMGPMGWAAWAPGMEFWPAPWGAGNYAPAPPRTRREPPRRSPAYGRGGDRTLRRWAERYGYDLEYTIPPRGRRR